MDSLVVTKNLVRTTHYKNDLLVQLDSSQIN